MGVKISNKMDPSDLVTLIAAVNPENVPGRLAVIVRMGAQKVPSLSKIWGLPPPPGSIVAQAIGCTDDRFPIQHH